MKFENASILAGFVVLDELARAGVRHVFITPGSRSTPLVLAASRHPDLQDHSVIDERSAAFAALGVGLATGQPAALICTSGTAAANYLPAICEADLGGVPMVVLTADRPPNLRDAGASQAMSQVGLYGDKTRWAVDLGLPEPDEEWLRHARSRAARAVDVARSLSGPVHLNMPFRKPLEATEVAPDHRDHVPSNVATSVAALGRADGAPWKVTARTKVSVQLPQDLEQVVASAKNPVILVGAPERAPWNVGGLSLESLASALGAPIIAESMSGLRRPASPSVIQGDLILADAEFVANHPVDLVIQLGRWPINWPVQKWLRTTQAAVVVVSDAPADPEHEAAFQLPGQPASLDALASVSREPADPRAWFARASELQSAFDAEVARCEALDGLVVRNIAEWGDPIFVSSSMPLRDLETFVAPSVRPLSVFANRGLNGIDGVISTAAGVSVALEQRVQVVIGDVAFAHDVTGLTTARRIGADLQVNVIDNGGGRIFDHLPVAHDDEAVFEKHFTTAPAWDFAAAAAAFGYTSSTLPCHQIEQARAHGGVVILTNRGGATTRTSDLVKAAIRARGEQGGVAPGEDAIVLLHGFTGDATTWSELTNHLDRPVFAVELLGHGRRPSHVKPTIDALVDDVLQQLDDAGIQRATLFGYSMGGRVAMALAARAPHRVRALITLGSHPGLEDDKARCDRRDHDWALADRVEREGLSSFLDFWMELPIFASQSALGSEWREASKRQRMRRSARDYALALRWSGTGTMAPLWNALSESDIPHLAIAGELDSKYSGVAADLVERTGATSAIIADAGHAAHYEQPAAVANAIAAFLGQCESNQSREAS